MAQDALDPPGGGDTPRERENVPQAGNRPRALLIGCVSDPRGQQDPENQLGPLRKTAARHAWVVAGELAFKQSRWDDESAAEVRAAVLKRLREGDVDVLAVWAWDRLSRQGIEAAFNFIRELEEHLKVHFFSLQEPFLSTAAPREQRELLLAVMAWAAKWESQRKSDRLVAKAVTKRAAAGKVGQRAVWGEGRLATPEEVVQIRARRAEGVRPLAREFGLSKSQVHRILSGGVKSA